MPEMAAIIDVVEAVKAVRRIPLELRPVTFFGKFDLWIYDAVLDNKLCEQCLEHEKHPRYFGNQLRSVFPDLEIIDENTIQANVHPYCRCRLRRKTVWSLDDLRWFVLLEIE